MRGDDFVITLRAGHSNVWSGGLTVYAILALNRHFAYLEEYRFVFGLRVYAIYL